MHFWFLCINVMYIHMYLTGHQFLSQIAHPRRWKRRQADYLNYVEHFMLNKPQNRIARIATLRKVSLLEQAEYREESLTQFN